MTISERPGIYAGYVVNSAPRFGGGGITVGVAAETNGGSAGSVSGYLDAVQKFGLCAMTSLIRILYSNGAGNIIAEPVNDDDYERGFKALLNADADIIICDCNTAEVLESMKAALEEKDYCFGIAEFDGSAAECAALAQELNFERMLLCGNVTEISGGIAAALAGSMAYENDPMMYFNGRRLYACGELENSYTQQETEALIAGGVTPVENDGSGIVTVRGITTKTSTDVVADKSLREANTVMVANEVIKTVSEALRLKFARSRNDSLTRGAIRSQVIVELEKLQKAGIIESYGSVSAVADSSDATVCRVSFEFTAAHGLNTILLTAYLEV